MCDFRPGELAQWAGRLWKNGMPEGVIKGVSKDTRTIKPGNLYIALRGDHFDGHDFVGEAFAKGAAAALVADDFQWKTHPVLSVTDTVRGLQDLAKGYRKKWIGTPVGVTGSVGKTTVKEMVASVLASAGRTHKTAGNYNNHIGLPLTMLSMPHSCRYGVFEIGMNHPGEIGALAGLLKPQVGILTDICNAHRESFASLEEIAREKAKLAEQVPASGLVLLDRDSEWFGMIRSNCAARVITVSLGGDADYSGQAKPGGILCVEGFDYFIPLPGEHMLRNALRAIAVGRELEIEPEQIAAGLRQFEVPPMRWQESEIGGIRFINDAYNANPLSMRANLRTFSALPVSGAKWAVIGGMRELGETAEKEHRELGEFVDQLPLDGVICVGTLAENIRCGNIAQFYRCARAEEAAAVLRAKTGEGDAVLLKASRGEKLEDVITFFKEN